MSALAKESQTHTVVNPMLMSLSTATPHSLTPTVSQDGSMITSTHLPDSAIVDHGDVNLTVTDTTQDVPVSNPPSREPQPNNCGLWLNHSLDLPSAFDSGH